MTIKLSIPPQNVIDDINSLKQSLNNEIPSKNEDNLLIATWNIRHFVFLVN